MNKNYVILDIKTNGDFDYDNESKITFIEAMKVDKKMNILDEIKLNMNRRSNVLEFVNFCKNSNIIVCNAKNTLSFILKMLYKNKVYDEFKFKYIDIKDMFKDRIDKNLEVNLDNIKKCYGIEGLDDIYVMSEIIDNYLKENNMDNLDKLLYAQINHGRIFRGLNYAKYICDIKIQDNKYYGYIVPLSKDKYVSYYSCLKELNGEYFIVNEINMLKCIGAVIIMNVGYLCEESMMFTDYYSVQAAGAGVVTSNCSNLIEGISKYIEYKKNNKKLKLVLWGSLENLTKEYKIIDKNILDEFISLIDIIKEPWDYWDKDEI